MQGHHHAFRHLAQSVHHANLVVSRALVLRHQPLFDDVVSTSGRVLHLDAPLESLAS